MVVSYGEIGSSGDSTRLLVELGVLSEDQQQRASLLREAQALNGNLVAAAQATLALKALATVG